MRFGLFLTVVFVMLTAAVTAAIWLAAMVMGFVAPVGPVGHPFWRFFPGFGLILCVAFLIGAFRRAALPVADLIEAARRIEAGDYSSTVPERGPPDVRALARGFNAMSAQLRTIAERRQTLMADVTHELRTPLTVIQGNLEGMIDGVYPADQAQLTALLEETRVLSRLIDDLRTLALAEAGALTLRKERTDVGELATEVVGSFRPRATAAGVSLLTDVATDLLILDVDPARIREVLENLIANALRHTPADGTVTVGCHPGDSDDVILLVEDTGTGIDPTDLPHIFERFYRARDSGGSGLGLAIVKDLVEAHGGHIAATSVPGRGTVIRCTFPVREGV